MSDTTFTLVSIKAEFEKEWETYQDKGDIRAAEVVNRMLALVQREINQLKTEG